MNFPLMMTCWWKVNELSFLTSCRDSIMEDLHRSHEGINKAMSLARTCVYWPGMEADITDYIKRCLTCIDSSNLPVETLHPHEVPPGPWVKVGMDFFQDDFGKKHLIVADYFSKFPFIYPVRSSHHFKTIMYLWELFTTEGCSHHCDVWQWPSIQWRWLQEFCKRVQLHSHNFFPSLPPVKWFHWGHGKES